MVQQAAVRVDLVTSPMGRGALLRELNQARMKE